MAKGKRSDSAQAAEELFAPKPAAALAPRVFSAVGGDIVSGESYDDGSERTVNQTFGAMQFDIDLVRSLNKRFGNLESDFHFAGYALERALSRLEWLLEEDRWRQTGDFADVTKFLEAINLEEFRFQADQRKRIAQRIKELEPEASNRKIAGALGTTHTTINNDFSGKKFPGKGKNASKNNGNGQLGGNNFPAMSGSEAARKVHQTQETAASRSAKEKKRKADLERPVEKTLVEGMHHEDFHTGSEVIPDNSVQLVFTDPPYDKDSVQLYEDAARIARRILRPGGSFVAYSGQRHLPAVLTACSRHLDYWWTISGIHGGGNQILQKLGIRCGWKPLVWFVKGTRGDVQNVIQDVVRGDREKEDHEWQQAESEASYFINALSSEDGVVVDFFAGSGTTGVAARKLGRRWIGFEINATAAETASRKIEEIDDSNS